MTPETSAPRPAGRHTGCMGETGAALAPRAGRPVVRFRLRSATVTDARLAAVRLRDELEALSAARPVVALAGDEYRVLVGLDEPAPASLRWRLGAGLSAALGVAVRVDDQALGAGAHQIYPPDGASFRPEARARLSPAQLRTLAEQFGTKAAA